MYNNNSAGLTVQHIKPCVSLINTSETRGHVVSSIEITTKYINNLNTPVTVVERSGMRHCIKSDFNYNDPVFIIRTVITVPASQVNDFSNILGKTVMSNNNFIDSIKESYFKYDNYQPFCRVIYVDHKVTQQTLDESGGCMFVHDKDVVVSTLTTTKTPIHPYCVEGIHDYILSDNEDKGLTTDSPVIKVEIVDNKNTLAKRFFYSLGSLHQIIPIRDERRLDGVYVTTLDKSSDGSNTAVARMDMYPLSDCETKLGIFRTREEAHNAGDTKLARKEEIAKLEHELIVLKQNHEKEMIKLKEDFEKRANDRKDSNEIIKILPVLILGIGAVFAAFSKLAK